MEIIPAAHAFEWVDNCPHCRRPMARVILDDERVRLLPESLHAADSPDDPNLPKWFKGWAAKPFYYAGREGAKTGDAVSPAFPGHYCPECCALWVTFRGLYVLTDFKHVSMSHEPKQLKLL